MTPFQESARMAGYICGLRGGDKAASRVYYKNPGDSLAPENTVLEFDRGFEDGQAIRGARMGYLPSPAPWAKNPSWSKETPTHPRAMMAEDIADKIEGGAIYRWAKDEEIRKLRTDAFHYTQYLLASGKMELAVPDYVMDFARLGLDTGPSGSADG